MKEARVILPLSGNNNKLLDLVHAKLEQDLCKTFGGCTRTLGQGCWQGDKQNYREEVYIYDVAMLDSTANNMLLDNIAHYAKVAGKQEAVYVRHACGEVIIS